MNQNTNTSSRPLRHAVLVLAWVAGAAWAQPASSADSDLAFDVAMAAYERNHWETAYAGFAALADKGHPAAGRIALQMWRYGPALYRRSFTAQPQQVKHWSGMEDCDRAPAVQACLHALRLP